MAEMIGEITNIKLATIANVDSGSFTLREASTGVLWVFYIWVSRDDQPASALQRVLHTQRLALAREAAFRKLTVHIFHPDDSSVIDSLQVDIP